MQWPTEEEQSIQWAREEEQSIQWAREKKTKEQPIIGKTLHKQRTDQVTRTPINRGVNAGAPEE